MSSVVAAEVKRSLIRASVQGIVYLIDSAAGRVYTYNAQRPVFVGVLEKIPEEDKNSISKTNGCMATARVRYRSDIREVMAAERALAATAIAIATAKSEAIGTPGPVEVQPHGVHS
jgi:hypothetical protein